MLVLTCENKKKCLSCIYRIPLGEARVASGKFRLQFQTVTRVSSCVPPHICYHVYLARSLSYHVSACPFFERRRRNHINLFKFTTGSSASYASDSDFFIVNVSPRLLALLFLPFTTLHSLCLPAHIGSTDLESVSNPVFALGGTVKVVCVPAESDPPRRLPATTLVLDEVTGGVKAVANARNLTALRNVAGP